MIRLRKKMLLVYLLLTLLIVVFDHLYPGENWVRFFKFSTMLSLALIVFGGRRPKGLIGWAVLFMVLGDFFLNYCAVFPGLARRLIPFGLVGFAISYFLLTLAFRGRFKFGIGELFLLLVVLSLLLPLFFELYPYFMGRFYFYGLLIFGLLLGYMAWTLMSTIFRIDHKHRVSCYVALAGFFILVSDVAVAHSLFNPAYIGLFIPWLENLIWITFVPAWTLLVIVSAELDRVLPEPNYVDKGGL
jgi:hypothetical protein